MDDIAKAIEAYVDADELAGAVTLVWRDGRIVQDCAVGWRDMDATALMTRDTIFRIASMTKPVTSVAALMLMEEGRFALDDPISRWAPEFAEMRVLRSPDGPLDETDPAVREITFDDLLTHRSGLTYGDIHTGPIVAAYRAALGWDIDSHVPPDAWIAALASLPLIDQPGAGFHYGHSADLLGLLIARMEGTSLGEVLARRIFQPLGMKDTGFIVSPDRHDRRARMYGFDAAGRMIARDSLDKACLAERPADMTYESGGQGLWSTVDDYLAFARLFVGEGAVDGVRLLKPQTLALMTANRLTEDQRARAETFGMPLFIAHGFGLGLAVVLDSEKAAATRCKGGVGTVGWPGAFGGWWQADPTDGSVMVFLAHNRFEPEQLAQGIGLSVYGAIVQFHALASALPH
ncbi:serine hydrolase [Phenylobacterium aquaticum]|uniref:serine hydrolase domain-containing protein n=1 Tax=Phenylobacterium aquaticum TaxID=1763816 RepID=UPI0026EE123A|nr:serine hydrolase domain-containing protein [Phenylobacterium aquaticum]